MSLDNSNTARKHNAAASGDIRDRILVETALDWFHRSVSHRRRRSIRKRRRSSASVWKNGSNDNSYYCSDSEDSDVNTAADPSTAAWRFLRYGKSGIAPIDAALKRNNDNENCSNKGNGRLRLGLDNKTSPPPLVLLEGPKDVGKTWMLLTLAARFVVATRSSRFRDENNHTGDEADAAESDRGGVPEKASDNSDGAHDQPKVLLLDSTYDFSVPQLVNVLLLTLRRERERHAQQVRLHRQGKSNDQETTATNKDGAENHSSIPRYEDELLRQEQERKSLEQDLEDCLGRIHIIQVDGASGWVPMLESLTHRLSDRRLGKRKSEEERINPTLLLWDGFLSDITTINNGGSSGGKEKHVSAHALFDGPVSREILSQVSRLLHQERDSLWCVMTARAAGDVPFSQGNGSASHLSTEKYGPRSTENIGIGFRMAEWIRKEEERREQQQDLRLQQQQGLQRSQFVRSRLAHNQPRNGNPTGNRRTAYRVRLDRRHTSRIRGEGHIPRTAAAAAALVAKIISPTSRNEDHDGKGGKNINPQTIPYSISLGGILS